MARTKSKEIFTITDGDKDKKQQQDEKELTEDMSIPGLDETETDLFYMVSMAHPLETVKQWIEEVCKEKANQYLESVTPK